jgi:LemA protein
MGALLVVIAVLLAIVVLVILWVMATYNRLVSQRNQVRNAWAQIDVQLRRRHDLIPNLVNAVKGYMEHERNVLQSVTDARTRAIAAGDNVAQRSEAEGELTRSLRSLFAVAEAYPALRASENVQSLQEELASTENRVAFARQHYNDAVMSYNTSRGQLPGALIATPMGFQEADSWEIDAADAAAREVPQVDLSGAPG